MGLVRDVLIARFLGAGLVSDAFFTAFKLPNVFRRMFAEGAFNAAFVPLYARRIEEEGEAAADEFAKEAMAALLVMVAAIVIVFELTMPWSLSIIGYGLDKAVDPDVGISPYYLAVVYAQITMPYLIFMSMTALFSGVLNTRNHFALAAAVPIVLNIFMISALFAAGLAGWGQTLIGYVLAAAITLSGFVQMTLVIWGCKKAGVRVGFKRPRLTPGVKRLVILGVPGLLSAGITQINLLVSHSIATMQKGAASWLTYADRLYQLPLGMIGIAMGVALLPALSRRLRAGELATSVAAWVNVICLGWLLIKNDSFVPDMRLLSRMPRIALASAAMAIGLIAIAPRASQYLSGNFVQDFIVLGVVCGVGFIIYAAAAALLRAFDMSDIRDALKRS